MGPGRAAAARLLVITTGAFAASAGPVSRAQSAGDAAPARSESEGCAGRTRTCAVAVVGGQAVELRAWGEDSVRVTATPEGAEPVPDGYPSALLPSLVDAGEGSVDTWAPSCLTTAAGHPAPGTAAMARRALDLQWHSAATVTSGNLRASVGADGVLSFTRVSDGAALLRESSPRAFAPSPSTPGWFSVSVEFADLGEERFYGLGQHQTGTLDNANESFPFQPVNTEILVPVLHSSREYSLLWNMPTLGTVTLGGRGGHRWAGNAVRHLSLWVTTTAARRGNSSSGGGDGGDGVGGGGGSGGDGGSRGDGNVGDTRTRNASRTDTTAAAAAGGCGGDANGCDTTATESHWAERMRKYTSVTGRAPLIGNGFMSGYWQSRNRYRNSSEVLGVIEGYARLKLPLAMVVIDYHSWDPAPFGTNRFWPACWPDPAGLVRDAGKSGVELMLSPYSNFIGRKAGGFDAAARARLLALDERTGGVAEGVSGTAMWDVFNPDARAAMMRSVATAKGSYGDVGIRHWWLDCDEPCESPGMQGAVWAGMPHAAVGAAYPHVLAEVTRSAMGPGTVMLGRSAWAGTQRFGAAVWSGDTNSSWAALREQVKAGLNAQLSGITYWTSDIGGYAGGGGGVNGTGYNHNIYSPAYLQLLTRWFQFGLFCPLFRSHGHRLPTLPPVACGAGDSGGYNEVWHFAEPYRSAIVRVMRMREALRPYIDELFAAAASHGYPLMRMLQYEFPDDSRAAAVADAYCFGSRFLVKPVVAPNVTSATVYLPRLPSGEAWRFEFDRSVVVRGGGRDVVVQIALDTFPLFERVSL